MTITTMPALQHLQPLPATLSCQHLVTPSAFWQSLLIAFCLLQVLRWWWLRHMPASSLGIASPREHICILPPAQHNCIAVLLHADPYKQHRAELRRTQVGHCTGSFNRNMLAIDRPKQVSFHILKEAGCAYLPGSRGGHVAMPCTRDELFVLQG